jgi:hypothetical protein
VIAGTSLVTHVVHFLEDAFWWVGVPIILVTFLICLAVLLYQIWDELRRVFGRLWMTPQKKQAELERRARVTKWVNEQPKRGV